jgi:hypothetical protein
VLNLDTARIKYVNKDINNPEYIFHGHHALQNSIIPRIPSINKTGNHDDTQFGIYGSVKINGAIPYSIKINEEYDDWEGRSFVHYFIPPEYDYEVAVIHYGEIDENATGYIYVLSAKTFKKSNDYQWISTVPVEPIDIVEVKYDELGNHFHFPYLKKR